METILEAQFQRIEVALEALVRSITTYNPSVSAAEELVAANDELGGGLEILTQHQANHARILALRQTADDLDAQVKASLQQLADARKELTSASLTAPPEPSRDVPFEDLIAYAQRISRYTVPPTLRPPLPMPLARAAPDATSRKPSTAESTGRLANGTPSSALGVDTPGDGDGTGATANGETQDRGIGWASLDESQRQWLDSIAKLQFVPWPRDDDIKSGGLARIQAMIEQGIDPAGLTKGRAELEEEARLKAEDEERALQDMKERKRRESMSRPAQGRADAGKGDTGFSGLDLYNPEES